MDKGMRRKSYLVITGVVLGILAACIPPNPPDCSVNYLITAINNANATPATTDTINMPAGCVYDLVAVDNSVQGDSGLPEIISPIIINGNDSTIQRSFTSATPNFRLFLISTDGNLTLNDLTLLNGFSGTELVQPYSIVSGGAIFNWGTLTINNSLFEGNRAYFGGGAIISYGDMEIADTTIRDNDILGDIFIVKGAGIYNGNAQAHISGSTINGNGFLHYYDQGGGIFNMGDMEIINSTLSGNAGLGIENEGVLDMRFSTIAFNGWRGIYSSSIVAVIEDSIIANNPIDCIGNVVQMIGVNIDTDGSCSATITVTPAQLQLDHLADNGGPTHTHALLSGSPAIDAAAGTCPPTDQRGNPRPVGAACDLGAFENTGATAAAMDEAEDTATPTATFTPAPDELVIKPKQDANCRYLCSSSQSEVADTLFEGVEYVPIGVDPEGFWMEFMGPATNQRCWVVTSLLDIQLNGESSLLGDLPEGMISNTYCPALPTATFTPTPETGSSGPTGPTNTPRTAQCNDGIDNDGDGFIDMRDSDCRDINDNDEANP